MNTIIFTRMKNLKRFNVRVYGILTNDRGEILVADEAFVNGNQATKFPGGGLELGEGTIDGLKREFMEEAGIEVDVKEHFYTTDFFVPSFFDLAADSQIISIYYFVESKDWSRVKTSEKKFDFEYIKGKEAESFRWVSYFNLDDETSITLPIDKVVVEKLKEKFLSLPY